MLYDNISHLSLVSEVQSVNGVFDPGPIYISVSFKPCYAEQAAEKFVELLEGRGIKAHLERWMKGTVGIQHQRICIDSPEQVAAVFDLMRDNGLISPTDRANLGEFVINTETMIEHRKKVSQKHSDITTAQKDIIISFIEPYPGSLFGNLSFDETKKLLKLAIGAWYFDPAKGSHIAKWSRILKMWECAAIYEKLCDKKILEDVCMCLTIISGMCSGMCGLNKTLLQNGEYLPSIPIIKGIILKYLIEECEKNYAESLYPGWQIYFGNVVTDSERFFHNRWEDRQQSINSNNLKLSK